MTTFDQPRTLGTEAALELLFQAWQDRIFTQFPGVVESYDPETKRADIRPVFILEYRLDDGSIRVDAFPVLPDVMITFPRGGGWVTTWPLKQGDPVLIKFSQFPLDEWEGSDGKTDITPQIQGRHQLADAFAEPTGFPDGNNLGEAHAENWRLEHEDGKTIVILKPDGTVQIVATKIQLGSEDAAEALALAKHCNDRLTALENHAGSHTHLCPAGTSATALPPGPSGGHDTSSQTVFTNK